MQIVSLGSTGRSTVSFGPISGDLYLARLVQRLRAWLCLWLSVCRCSGPRECAGRNLEGPADHRGPELRADGAREPKLSAGTSAGTYVETRITGRMR